MLTHLFYLCSKINRCCSIVFTQAPTYSRDRVVAANQVVSSFLLSPHICLRLTIVCIYKLCLIPGYLLCVLLHVQLCVVIFFSDGLSHDRARTFIQQMHDDHVSSHTLLMRFTCLLAASCSHNGFTDTPQPTGWPKKNRTLYSCPYLC